MLRADAFLFEDMLKMIDLVSSQGEQIAREKKPKLRTDSKERGFHFGICALGEVNCT
jgi:hypothetical protein